MEKIIERFGAIKNFVKREDRQPFALNYVTYAHDRKPHGEQKSPM